MRRNMSIPGGSPGINEGLAEGDIVESDAGALSFRTNTNDDDRCTDGKHAIYH